MKINLVKKLYNNHIICEDEIPIYEYGIFVIWFNAFCVFVALVIATLLGKLSFSLEIFLFYIPVRILLGGYHCSNPKSCICFFISLFSSILLINNYIPFSAYRFFILFLILIAYLIENFINKRYFNSKVTIILLVCLIIYRLLLTTKYCEAICCALLFNIVFYYLKLGKSILNMVFGKKSVY